MLFFLAKEHDEGWKDSVEPFPPSRLGCALCGECSRSRRRPHTAAAPAPSSLPSWRPAWSWVCARGAGFRQNSMRSCESEFQLRLDWFGSGIKQVTRLTKTQHDTCACTLHLAPLLLEAA